MLFCACSAEDASEDAGQDIPQEVSQNTSDVSAETPFPTITEKTDVPEKLAALKTLDWTELTCYADKTTSLKNSNLLNSGYLTYDESGNIYFADRNSGGIYTSGCHGEDKRLLNEDSGFALQTEGDWLYYHSTAGGIKRIHTETGEVETVYEAACGEFAVIGERVYINAAEGFCITDTDGENKELWQKAEEQPRTALSKGNGMWLSNSVNDTDIQWFWKGYLLVLNEDNKENLLLNQRGAYPLVAGNLISVFDVHTNTRHIWNLKTKEDIDLNVYAQRVVSDGAALYYIKNGSSKSALWRWTEEATEELLLMEAKNIEFTYLTEDAFYWMAQAVVDKVSVQQLWYYDLTTGETGQIY